MSHNPDNLLFEPIHPANAATYLRTVARYVACGETGEALELIWAMERQFQIDAAFVEKQNRYPHPDH